jgi:hypothetical protein
MTYKHKRDDTKRITVHVDANIEVIRDFIEKETGVRMTYIQLFDYLIHFYMKHAQEPRTKWAALKPVAA